ncbi:MAG: PAS domain S-box protein [Syntrophobacteraceae bacterium]
MKQSRSFVKILLWSAAVTCLVALLATCVLTNITLRSIEKNLPNTLFEQLDDLTKILEDLSKVVHAAQIAKAAPNSEHFARLRQEVTAVHAAITNMRNSYLFDNLVHASAFHEVAAPAIADIQVWLSEGVSGYAPESSTAVDIILNRAEEALRKARTLNNNSKTAAQYILNEQRKRLDRFLFSVNLLFGLGPVIAIITILSLISQHVIHLRELKAQAQRRQAEEQLLESESTLQSIFKAAPIGIGLICNRVLVQVNDRMCEMVQYSREELTGSSIRLLYPDQDEFRRVCKDHYDQISQCGTSTIETRWTRKGGSFVEILLNATPLDPGDQSAGVTLTALDITERKLNETALFESQERFRELAELLPETIFETNASGDLTFVNQKAYDYFGYTQEDLERGLNCFGMISPEDRPRAVENARRILGGEKIGLTEYRAIKKDGSSFPIVLHFTAKHYKGKPAGFRGIVIDITDTKKLEAQLLHALKMEAVGTLAGGIAHDFNNLLQAILGYAELLILKNPEGEEGSRELREIEHAARRGGELTRQLLTFSRKVDSNLKPIDLNRIVEDVRLLLERTIPKMISIKLHLMECLDSINADAPQIEQLLMNVAINARDAMPHGGTLSIETKNVTLDDEYCHSRPDMTPGDYVLLTVTDTGQGMDEATLEHIFDPFFTTKEVGKGTGLGLAIVFGIVKSHNGHILCISKPKEGTTFEFYFSAVQQPKMDAEPVAAGEATDIGHGTVLLVDDDEAIRLFGEQILQLEGYSVISVEDAARALEIYGDQKDRIDLVILDLIMPGLGGVHCMHQILAIDPQAKILIATGYPEDGGPERLMEKGAKAFICKPYRIPQMLEVVRKTLNQEV